VQLTSLRTAVNVFAGEFQDLIALIESSESTRDRLEQTGVLRPEKARDLGIVGVAGRASGMNLDTRRDHPYAAYGRYSFRVPVYHVGDVSHRMQVRVDEVNGATLTGVSSSGGTIEMSCTPTRAASPPPSSTTGSRWPRSPR